MDDFNYRVSVEVKEGIDQIASVADARVLPESVAAVHVRQMAVHANLAVLAQRNQNSTWLDRLKQIDLIKKRHAAGGSSSGGVVLGVGGGGGTFDFTKFT